MPELILHGAPRSNLVRTALITLAEKGVEFTHDPARPQTPEQLARRRSWPGADEPVDLGL